MWRNGRVMSPVEASPVDSTIGLATTLVLSGPVDRSWTDLRNSWHSCLRNVRLANLNARMWKNLGHLHRGLFDCQR